MEVDLEPVPFTKRVSHPPYARGGYNSEEWVFDDEDDDDLPAEQSDFGGEEDPRHHHAAGIPDDGIRSLEVSFSAAFIAALFCFADSQGISLSQCNSVFITHIGRVL